TYRYVIHHTGGESPIRVCTLLLGQGEMDLAEEYARKQLTLNPEETGLLPFLRELSPTNETLAFIEPFLDDRPLRLDWHRHYVDLAIALGSRTSISERYAQFSKAEPENGDLHFLLGQTKEDPEDASDDYLLAAKHGSPEANYQLSLRQSALGDFAIALTHAQNALQARPDQAAFQAQEEDLLLATAQYDKLISRYRLLLEKDPLDQESATTLAGLYEVTGESEQAQSLTDRFIQTIAFDGSLLSEETSQFREIMDGVRAQWAGDSAHYIAAHQGFDPTADVNVLILKGSIHEAAAAIDRGAHDPFVHFLLYALASRQEDHLALAEVQLSQALTLLKDDPVITPLFQSGTPAPTLIETLEARLPNHHRRVLLFALAQHHPKSAETYLTLAKQLNYNRVFPYLSLAQALAD
ncbi:MAG: tetratricopeptide (TPR) repeat protein, partial [Verrucomicrobiales bacterium]